MTSPQNLSAILDRLTDAQRRLLGDALYTNRWRVPRTNAALARLGIIAGSTTCLTPLGLAVIAALREGTRP